MRAVVAPRAAAYHTSCDCCGRGRRCARIWIDRLGNDVRACMDLCSSCCRAAWDAAKKLRRGERP